MKAKLFMLTVSHPAVGSLKALEHKGVDTKVVKLDLVGGLHDIPLRLNGFKEATVPALKIEGRKVQGTTQITRVLDELVPDRPLFPADPERRRAVEEAERWGESVFQETPRTAVRAALVANPAARRTFAGLLGLPSAIAPGMVPIVRRLAQGRDPEQAKAAIAKLPGELDHIDGLIADGVVGDPAAPNAADFQLAATLRLLLGLEDLRSLVEGRPCADLGRRIVPDFPGPVPAGTIPADWL